MAKRKARSRYWLVFKGYPYGDKSKMVQTYNIPCRTRKDAEEWAKVIKGERDVWDIQIHREKLKGMM